MSFSSRSVAIVGLLLGTIFCWSSAVVAADWPHRTVRLIAPVPAGSASDFSARLFAERLSQRWGQPVIVENRPGADGVIGVSAFLGTDDDHTLLYAISAVVTVHPMTHEKLPYDPVRELVPISSASGRCPCNSGLREEFDPLARRFGSSRSRPTGQAELGQFARSSALRRRRVPQEFETGSRFCFLSRPRTCSPGSGRGPHRCIRSRAGCDHAAGAVRQSAAPCSCERRSRAACSGRADRNRSRIPRASNGRRGRVFRQTRNARHVA